MVGFVFEAISQLIFHQCVASAVGRGSLRRIQLPHWIQGKPSTLLPGFILYPCVKCVTFESKLLNALFGLRRRRCPIFGIILIQSGPWKLVEVCTSFPMRQLSVKSESIWKLIASYCQICSMETSALCCTVDIFLHFFDLSEQKWKLRNDMLGVLRYHHHLLPQCLADGVFATCPNGYFEDSEKNSTV